MAKYLLFFIAKILKLYLFSLYLLLYNISTMNIKTILSSCVLLLTGFLPAYNSGAQNISFFNDYLNNVEVFTAGNTKQIEHLPLKSYSVSNNMLAYEDNSGNFKIYHNHYLHQISSFTSSYVISDILQQYI